MATYGSHSTQVSINWLGGKVSVRFDWLMASYDPGKKTSTIEWTLKLITTGAATITQLSSPAPTYEVNIGGQKFTGTSDINIGIGKTKTLQSGSVVIQHDSKGSAKTITYSYQQKLQNVGDANGTSTAALDAIPTEAAIESAPNFDDTDNPTITYFAGRGVKTLQACIANSTGNTIYAAYRDIPKDSTSYTFELTSAERTTLRNAAASSASLSLRFYVKSTVPKTDGTTHTGYSFISRTFSIDGGEPELSPAVTVTDSTTKTLTGRTDTVIPGVTDVSYTIGASGVKGASITAQSATCGGVTKTTASGSFSDITVSKLTFACTDSRGKRSTAEVNLYSIDYFKVTCNQDVRLNLDGTVDLTITGNYFNGSFGAQNNTLTVEIRHREAGGTWSSWGAITPLVSDISGGTYTLAASISGFDPSGTYEFQSRATDKLVTAYSGDSSIVLSPIFDWSRTDFNFNVPVTMNGQTVLRHNETANNLVVSASGGFIYLRPGGTNDTSAEVLITPQGNIQLSGDIIINGKSLKSLLGIE